MYIFMPVIGMGMAGRTLIDDGRGGRGFGIRCSRPFDDFIVGVGLVSLLGKRPRFLRIRSDEFKLHEFMRFNAAGRCSPRNGNIASL